MIPKWASSAITATFFYHENVDYVVKQGDDGHLRIEPVDRENTGDVQKTLHLCDGLYEFLQMKHSLKLHPETITSCFVSNMEYLLK